MAMSPLQKSQGFKSQTTNPNHVLVFVVVFFSEKSFGEPLATSPRRCQRRGPLLSPPASKIVGLSQRNGSMARMSRLPPPKAPIRCIEGALTQPGFETPKHLRGFWQTANGGVGSSIESPRSLWARNKHRKTQKGVH